MRLEPQGQIRLGDHRMDLRPIPESDILFVAAEADVPDLTQQGALVAERGVNRLDRDPGIAGDVSDRGCAISLSHEKVVGSLDDPLPGFARLFLPPG